MQLDEPLIVVWNDDEVEHINNNFAFDDGDVRQLKAEGCCRNKCIDTFSIDDLNKLRSESKELDYYREGTNLLDLATMAQFRSMTRNHDSVKTGKGQVEERKNLRTIFVLRGEKVWEKLFLFAQSIKIKR